jgi:hypothetical protein
LALVDLKKLISKGKAGLLPALPRLFRRD